MHIYSRFQLQEDKYETGSGYVDFRESYFRFNSTCEYMGMRSSQLAHIS